MIDKLLTLKPREESGSKTSRKYSFQQDLSLFLLIKKHEKVDDYVYLFDFHDDLIVLDSSVSPQKIDFYQIKSKDKGNWTISALTKTKKDELSILGKLYSNKLNFPNHTQSLNFITNAPFSFKKLNTDEDSIKKRLIKASELCDESLKLCHSAIQEELSITNSKDFNELTLFEVTELSNTNSSTHCLGELASLIYKLNPENKINAQLAYNQIKGEVVRKSSTTTNDISLDNLEGLIELKGITKEQFLGFLNKAGLYKSVDEEWNEIQPLLQSCGIEILELQKYKKYLRDVSMALINDVNKIPFQNLLNEINQIFDDAIKSNIINDKSNLVEIINYCKSKLKTELYNEYFVKSLIIKVIYGKQ